MNALSYYWPLRWPAAVGFHKPTPQAARRRSTPSLRTSSRRLGQGGRVETIMQGIWPRGGHSPHNLVSTVVGLEPLPYGLPFSNPTTPAAAVVDPCGSPPVPSGLRPSADAGVSLVPAALAPPTARRWWSAYADDWGRSAFLLEPPSSRPKEGGCAAMLFWTTRKSRDALKGRPGPSQGLGRWRGK
jgi:hypothetical protein